MTPQPRIAIYDEVSWDPVLASDNTTAALIAVRLEGPQNQFHLIKARHYPSGFGTQAFVLSHFSSPIGPRTLNRYITANL